MRRRRFKILFGLILAGLVIPILFLVFEHLRGRISLDHYLQGLAAKGEKLSLAELHPPVPADQNGAPEIFAALQRIQEHAIIPKPMPLRMELLPSGHAIVGFRETNWTAASTNDWVRLAAELHANDGALELIHTGLEKPHFDNQIDYSAGFHVSLEHLSSARSLVYWFGARSQLALHENHPGDAVDDLITQLRLSRLVAEDGLLMSELVRISMMSLVRNSSWEALQGDFWTEADLTRLQAAWERQEYCHPLVRSLEGERLNDEIAYDLLRASNEDTAEMLFGLPGAAFFAASDRPFWERALARLPGGRDVADFISKQVYCRVWRFAWSCQAERQTLEQQQHLIELVRNSGTRKSWVELKPAIEQLGEEEANRNWYDRLRLPDPILGPDPGDLIEKTMRAETERSLVLAAIAIKRYSLRHGRAPATLDALVPEFLAAVPIDYMDGQPIRYHARPDGGFVLYSVGADGENNDGDAALLPDKSSYRNLWDRRDVVWPAPASSEEIEAYHVEAAKN